MATVTSPLFSSHASGSVAKVLTFASPSGNGKTIVRRYKASKAPSSAATLAIAAQMAPAHAAHSAGIRGNQNYNGYSYRGFYPPWSVFFRSWLDQH